MDLKDAFLGYLEYERNYSIHTLVSYRSDLESFEHFFKSLDNQLTWENIDQDIVRQWMVSLMKEGQKETSVNRHLSSLRSLYKYALKRDLLHKNPLALLKGPKKRKPLPVFLKESEMDKLLDEVQFPDGFSGTRDKLILVMFYHTGIRLSELVGLNVADVDMELKQVKVMGKRRKERLIPFGDELWMYVRAYLALRPEGADAFFLTEKGKPLSRVSVGNIVRKYLSMVTTLQKRSPHVIRHTFATVMLNHQADLESVRKMLGHSSLSTTEIYTHTTFEELKKVYKQAHPRA